MPDERISPPDQTPVSSGSSVASPSRRKVLALGGSLALGSVAGCLGGGSAGTTDSGAPEPPWTTQQLADHIDDDAKLTIYASTGSDQQWYDLIDVINDEFDTNLEGDVFASYGSQMTQRFIQEHQAGNYKADILSSPSGIDDKMKVTAREDGKEAALDIGRKYFEWDLDQNFWFKDVLQDVQKYPFYVAAYNGGPGLTIPINKRLFEERGLDVPETYNDLFDDQYEGMKTMISSSYIASDMAGWIIRHHAAQTDMSNIEWARKLQNHLQYAGASSHTAGAREVRDGNAPMMLYNWPTVLAPLMGDDSDLDGIFPKDVKGFMNGSPVAINKNAPHPWVARFFLSALLEESVQRRMINDVTNQIPCRLDLDYSVQNPDTFTKKRLNTDFEPVEFWNSWENAKVGQEAKDEGVFEL